MSVSGLRTALQGRLRLASRRGRRLRLKRFLFQMANVRSGRQPLGQLVDGAVQPRNGAETGIRLGWLAVGVRQFPGHLVRQRSPGQILLKISEDTEPAGIDVKRMTGSECPGVLFDCRQS
jgi:hypothetical protein